jgi:ATP phosphoribosyltransferase
MSVIRGFAARSSEQLIVAIPGGSLNGRTLNILDQVGFNTAPVRANPRRQLFPEIGVMTMRPSDVVTYVSAGAADVGVVGKDVITEYTTGGGVYELLDLGFGACRMVLATIAASSDPVTEAMRHFGVARIASKYPQSARRWAQRTGRSIEVVELKGSVELAPVVGLADGIVDIVQSGRTLAENGLKERETIAESSARLIANVSSFTNKGEMIRDLTAKLEAATKADVEHA